MRSSRFWGSGVPSSVARIQAFCGLGSGVEARNALCPASLH